MNPTEMKKHPTPEGAAREPNQFWFKVYRDSDTWRLRKVVVQIHHNLHMSPLPVDRTRMFAGPFFVKRLQRRMMRMAKRANNMVLASEWIARINKAK